MKIIGGKISLEVDRALLELNVGAISDTKRLGKMLRVHLCQLYQIILECPDTDWMSHSSVWVAESPEQSVKRAYSSFFRHIFADVWLWGDFDYLMHFVRLTLTENAIRHFIEMKVTENVCPKQQVSDKQDDPIRIVLLFKDKKSVNAVRHQLSYLSWKIDAIV